MSRTSGSDEKYNRIK